MNSDDDDPPYPLAATIAAWLWVGLAVSQYAMFVWEFLLKPLPNSADADISRGIGCSICLMSHLMPSSLMLGFGIALLLRRLDREMFIASWAHSLAFGLLALIAIGCFIGGERDDEFANWEFHLLLVVPRVQLLTAAGLAWRGQHAYDRYVAALRAASANSPAP